VTLFLLTNTTLRSDTTLFLLPTSNVTVTKKRNVVQVLVKKALMGFVLLEVSSHFYYWAFVKILRIK
jgi:hypothetical protein